MFLLQKCGSRPRLVTALIYLFMIFSSSFSPAMSLTPRPRTKCLFLATSHTTTYAHVPYRTLGSATAERRRPHGLIWLDSAME